MLAITCPVCGLEADETEFHAGGESHIRRPASHDPANITEEAQRDYLYVRANPRGIAHELWRCERGCGKWFHAVRDTVTLEFSAFYRIGEEKPDKGPDTGPQT